VCKKSYTKNEAVILEKPVAPSELLKKRIKKLGWWKVAGQLLFQFSIAKILKQTSRKRKEEILREYGLENTIVPENKIIKVTSVNGSECIEVLRK